jgi:peptidoglycan/LPS O-acetylase OafA/YrhL
MATILDKEEQIRERQQQTPTTAITFTTAGTARSVGLFYWRRVRRIVPVYLLDVLLVLAVSNFLLVARQDAIDGLKQEAKWALAFATNIWNTIRRQKYGEMVMHIHFVFFRLGASKFESQI